MATSLHRVFENFVWRVESLIPTDQVTSRAQWRHNPRVTTLEPGQSSGTTRMFEVLWTGSEAAREPTDAAERESLHAFELKVYYAGKYDSAALQRMVLQDRHDLITELRDTDSYAGYKDTITGIVDSTARTGLVNRYYEAESLDQPAEQVWTLTLRFRCDVFETEA